MSKGWTAAIQAVGAVAGLGLLATFVGGSMLWLRFDALDLPADRAVALLPKEMLVVVGAHALVVPVLVGLLAVLALVVLDPDIDRDEISQMGDGIWLLVPSFAIGIALIVALTVGVETKSAIVLAAIALAGVFLTYKLGRPALRASDDRGPGRAFLAYLVFAIAVVAILVLWDDFAIAADADLVPDVLLAVGVGLLAFYLLLEVARKTDRLAYFSLTLFGVFAVLGGLSAVAKTSWEPRMEPLAVLLKDDPRGLAGFFVGETSDRLYFVSLPSNGDPGDPLADAEVDRVTSVPRAKVVQLAMREPVGVSKDEPGREQANTLLSDLKQGAASADPTVVEPITTANPQVAFAPLVHLHADEDLMPMSPLGFLDGSVLRWSNLGEGCEDTTIAAGHQRAGDVPADVPGLRHARLGEATDDPYTYGPGAECLPADAEFAADFHTRPHDGDRDDELGEAQGFYLDLDDGLRGGRGETEHAGPQRYLRNVPVYVEQHGTSLSDELVEGIEARLGEVDRALQLTYWFFYGLSRPPGVPQGSQLLTHEGDWERISVTVARLGGPTSNRYLPVSVRYHHHDDARVLPWYAVRRTAGSSGESATHPVVYSALGSHASYWRAGRYETEYRPNGERLFAVNDDAIACQECPQWQTWLDVRDVLGQRWYGFGGAWGDVSASTGETGPLGPSQYKVDGLGTPTTETVGRGAPVPSAPADVQDLVRGDDD